MGVHCAVGMTTDAITLPLLSLRTSCINTAQVQSVQLYSFTCTIRIAIIFIKINTWPLSLKHINNFTKYAPKTAFLFLVPFMYQNTIKFSRLLTAALVSFLNF